MPFCMVVKCGSTSLRDRDLHFYRIPSAFTRGGKEHDLLTTRREKWIEVLKRDDLTESKIKYGRICSKHFISGKPSNYKDINNPDWAPTQNMGYKSINNASVSAKNRFERMKRRELNNNITVLTDVTSCSNIMLNNVAVTPDTNNMPFDDNIITETPDNKVTIEDLNLALLECNKQIYDLRDKLNRYELTMEFFENNDDDTSYFTGLPTFVHLKSIFEVVEDLIPYTPTSALSKFQQLILTLVKLRLNLPFKYLGYRFNCHPTSAGRIFTRTIEILHSKLRSLIIWPEREDLVLNVPRCFRTNFGSAVTVVIDCFEVFVEKSSNLDAAAKTWSNYKHHHTLKFLIGITPQGVICFISNAYGGRASDKYITENCGFLDKLIPGDYILADRGFLIKNSVELCYAKVIMPAFRNGKKQLSAKEIEDTRKIGNVRIHIERVIGMLRQKFTIFSDTLPLTTIKKNSDEFALIDKIVVVCCSLINLMPPIVPLE